MNYKGIVDESSTRDKEMRPGLRASPHKQGKLFWMQDRISQEGHCLPPSIKITCL